jgi:hypothetical protein
MGYSMGDDDGGTAPGSRRDGLPTVAVDLTVATCQNTARVARGRIRGKQIRGRTAGCPGAWLWWGSAAALGPRAPWPDAGFAWLAVRARPPVTGVAAQVLVLVWSWSSREPVPTGSAGRFSSC